MANRIVLITGSPRNGNSAAMAYAFEQAAKKRGNEVIRFDANSLYVEGCRACGQCYKVPGIACGLTDDFNKIADAVLSCNAVVFATPLYYFGVSAQLKAVIDRFYTLNNPKEQMMEKQSVLLVSQAQPSANASAGLMMMIREIAHYYHWLERGSVIACDVRAPGDIEKTAYLDQAYALGKSL